MQITSFTICFVSGVIGVCFIANKIYQFKKYEMQEDRFKEWTKDD